MNDIQTMQDDAKLIEMLRAEGWMVAVHNDYRLNGSRLTFWLLTNDDGHFVKGEGETDGEALLQCRQAADRLSTPPHDRATREGFSPCPTCHQYSHSIGDDKLADAFNHFQSMFSHRGDGIPTQFNFGEQTRDAAQVLMAAADRGGIRREARQCSVCTAVVAEYPEGMCCHCHEMPWPVQALKETPDGP